MNAAAEQAVRFGGLPVRHTASGTRVTRITYRGVRDASGTLAYCSHYGHRSPEAAAACARKTVAA